MSDLTQEQIDSFKAVTEPVIKWLCDNMRPHSKVIIECDCAELVEGSIGYTDESHIHD